MSASKEKSGTVSPSSNLPMRMTPATLARIEPGDDPVNEQRRKLLTAIAAVAVGSGLLAVAADKVYDAAADWISSRSEWERKNRRARLLFQELFGSPAPIRRCHSGAHPDNLVAELKLHPFLQMYEYQLQRDADGTLTEIDLEGDLISFGGPNSTRLTRLAWEFDGEADDELDRDDDALIPLRYAGISNRKSPHLPPYRIAYRRANNNAAPAIPWPLYDLANPDRRWTPRAAGKPIGEVMGDDGRLLKVYEPLNNFLIITKLPNYLCRERRGHPSAWPQLVVFDGSNGIGTRGAELLIEPQGCEILEQIKSETQGVAGFQAMLEVYDIEHTGEGDRFTRIKLVDGSIAPLTVPSELYQAAHIKVAQRARPIAKAEKEPEL
jgi:hypothetical protein